MFQTDKSPRSLWQAGTFSLVVAVLVLLLGDHCSVAAAKKAATESIPKAPSLDHRRDRPFGGIGFPNFGPHRETLRLTTWKAVQEELELDDEQRSKLQPLLTKLYEARQAWSRAGSDPKLFAKEAEFARHILTRKQQKRLDQIVLQRRGLPALLADDIVEILGLTENQRQVIDDAWAVHIGKATRKEYQGTEGREAKYKVWHLALTTMTGKQRKQFRKMTGPIVELWPVPIAKLELEYQRDRPFGGIGFFEGNRFPDSYEFLKLVTYRPVQGELDLNNDQLKELLTVREALNRKYNPTELRKDPELLDQEYSQAMEILTRDQIKRVRQIMVQRDGMRALMEEENQKALGMTAQQSEKIRKAWLDHIERGKAKYPGTTGRNSVHQCWKDALMALTKEQRQKFAEMTGPIIR